MKIRLLHLLNEYHQPGLLRGTVQIEEEPEQDIILWGSRRHSFGKGKPPLIFTILNFEIFVYFANLFLIR